MSKKKDTRGMIGSWANRSSSVSNRIREMDSKFRGIASTVPRTKLGRETQFGRVNVHVLVFTMYTFLDTCTYTVYAVHLFMYT